MKNYGALSLVICLAIVFALSSVVLAQTEGKEAEKEAEPEAAAAKPEAAAAEPEKAKPIEKESNPLVIFETTKGKMTIELYPKEAPVTVENFLTYVKEGFYEGTVFHRVIPRFVIQGGGMTADMERKKTHDPIVNEANNGLKNLRGTLSMARTNDPNSATSQFFINLVDNSALDYSKTSPGYAVFGKVIRGLDIVDAIAAVQTTTKGQYRDVPVQPITVTKAYVKIEEKAEDAEVTEGKAVVEPVKKAADKKAKEAKATDN